MSRGTPTIIVHWSDPIAAARSATRYDSYLESAGINANSAELVMKEEVSPLLRAAPDRGLRTQRATSMMFGFYREFFRFGSLTPATLRAVAALT